MVCFSLYSHTLAHIAMFLFLITLLSPVYATEPNISPRIQEPLAAYLPRLGDSGVRPAVAYAYSATTAITYGIMTCTWDAVPLFWAKYRVHAVKIALWSLCISLMVVSCVIEHEPSLMRLWLALCLQVSWLVPISLHLHKVIRELQMRGRIDSFIVTTAMLSFTFIKAFALLDGYNMVALLRVSPCFTLAAWIASRWCNFDTTPEIRFGA